MDDRERIQIHSASVDVAVQLKRSRAFEVDYFDKNQQSILPHRNSFVVVKLFLNRYNFPEFLKKAGTLATIGCLAQMRVKFDEPSALTDLSERHGFCFFHLIYPVNI